MPLTSAYSHLPVFDCSFLIWQSISTVTKKVGREERGGVNPINQFHIFITVMVNALVEEEFYTNG